MKMAASRTLVGPTVHTSTAYLLQAAHEVVANWRSRQVSCTRAPTNIEKVIRA